MNETALGMWRHVSKNEAIRDFIRGCYAGLTGDGRYCNFYDLNYTYDVGKKTAKESGKTYCIIQEPLSLYGTFEMWLHVAAKIMIALKDGYIPIVDLRGDNTLLWTENEHEEIINYWDIYFKQYQPEALLEKIRASEDYVILSEEPSLGVRGMPALFADEHIRKEYHLIFERCGFNKETLSHIETPKFHGRTLGITIRRGMEWGQKRNAPLYTQGRGHHIDGFLETYEQWIDKNMEEIGFDSFFLATEDRETLEFFKERYGNCCVYANRPRVHMFENGVPITPDNEESKRVFFQEYEERIPQRKLQEYGYIAETLALSKCDMLLWNNTIQTIMTCIVAEQRIPLIDNHIFLDMYLR